MVKLIGGRAASAVIGLFMLAIGSSASAQDLSAASLVRPAVATTTAVANSLGAVTQAQPAQSVTVKLAASIAAEAAWLYKGGWPLYALVDKYSVGAPLDEQANCLATAVYFEARGESVEGQLAVARVVMNRAASGLYPTDWCSVVKQPAQFSFVRRGEFPAIDTASAAWGRAQGVARLAMANVVPSVDQNVLWYHATYVDPSWGHRLNMVEKIGAHLFYRA
ncbi:MAG: cell wall hydrolase [Sphingomonas sp.]|nr:cell wall hydrolase [Sphingomonas sp.]